MMAQLTRESLLLLTMTEAARTETLLQRGLRWRAKYK